MAEYVAQNYYYFLYLMGSSSRGDYPPRFGGMLWGTTGDMRIWGSQHWWHNMSCYYDPLIQANHHELVEPVFNMYTGMYKNCERAAEQQWGSKGIYIPETVWFDGLAELPDDIAEEMRELYLGLKPWSMASVVRGHRDEQLFSRSGPRASAAVLRALGFSTSTRP